MRQQKKSRQENEYNFWQPATDLMTGLVFILMLLVALLGLYLLYTPSLYEAAEPTTEAVHDDYDGNVWESETYHEKEDSDDEYGDGDGKYDEIIISGGDGEGYGDDGSKSAVLVEVIDGETERLIQKEGIRFELYKTAGALQILNTYYPEKISFRKFETTEKGFFYLPEKIHQGAYYFHGLTAPDGYDPAENQYFEIEETYDWSEPYLVKIPLFPSKNRIYIQMTDAESGLPVSGGTFQVLAAEDIVTLDSTLRHHSGEVVGELICDENGYGKSDDLYLGNYKIVQKEIPSYYVSMDEPLNVTVKTASTEESSLHEIKNVKTKLRIQLSDELYPNRAVAGAEFLITKESDPSFSNLVQTDSYGNITLSDLEKNSAYCIMQKSSVENYRPDMQQYTFYVDAAGRIDDKPESTFMLTNRMLRVSINTVDAILGNQISDIALELYDSSDRQIHTWQSSESGSLFTDLSEGSYYVVKNGDMDKRYELHVTDTGNIQVLDIPFFTWMSAAAILGAILLIILLIVLLTKLVKIFKKHFKKGPDEKTQR